MKDNSLDGHRGKVALSDTTRHATPISTSSNANPLATGGLKCDLKSSPQQQGPSSSSSAVNDGSAATNFDDDYNEWELGIGDLIIDLDADIEKTNERNGGGQQGIPHHHAHHHHHHQNGSAAGSGTSSSSTGNSASIIDSPNSSSSSAAFSFLGTTQAACSSNSGGLAAAAAMSNSKSPRLAAANNSASSSSSSSAGVPTTGAASGTFEHQATVDKGLKMKIKRKTVGSKYSEAKHEIVQSDTKSTPSSHPLSENANSSNCSNAPSASNSPAVSTETPKSKHSSSKGRNSSHREKKEKNRDKDKSSNARNSSSTQQPTSSAEVNGVLGVMSPLKITNSEAGISSPAPPSLCSNSSPLPPLSSNSAPSPSVPRGTLANSPVSNSSELSQPALLPSQVPSTSPPMPNLTLKLESKFPPASILQSCPVPSVVIKSEDRPPSPPLKKIKLEPQECSDDVDHPGSPGSPEMKDTSTCTTCASVGTITEPDCLGPCEPGTSVMLEGIVWQETEGGVLVVNVTWRGKTYVGTLLDCTKHDWAPPRFCESPTSDADSKTSKGRGKRGRGGNNSSSEVTFTDTRNCIQSKLRNGKGRRTTVNSNSSTSGFTVPNSPAKSDSSSSGGKRKSRASEPESSSGSGTPADKLSSKRSRNQKTTPTAPAATPVPAVASPSPAVAAESSQPSSPQWITCPEPNCNKKYKHINGLKYHKAHAHSVSEGGKVEDPATEDSKDVTNSSDNEESMQESASVSTSPAPSFANAVPSSAGKVLLNGENASSSSSSSSSSMNGLPDSDPYSLTTDLSTLASVAIGDSGQKTSSRPVSMHSSVSQDIPLVNADGEGVPMLPAPLSDALPSGGGLSTTVSAVTTSVIQSSNSVDSIASSQGVTMNIPTPHVIFSQALLESSSSTTCASSAAILCNTSVSPSVSNLSTNVTTTFANVSSITSTNIVSPSGPLPVVDKCKIKQERPDKYKPKSPLAASPIRPIVPAPTPILALSSNMPGSHPLNMGGHCVSPSLKPIQPKPTILGEPSSVNPALECLKKEKSKHKKKSKDKEREKKVPSLPLTPTKLGMNPNEECEALELTSYPSLEAVSGPLSGASHPTLSPLISQSKPPDTSMDMSLPEDTMNENVQSPAYSDISDANDTAPVLESEVPSGKEKEDKVGKSTPDASQSPATNISAYGMYPYYSQPPYLLPSVSPQSAPGQSQNVIEKNDLSKKGGDPDRTKDSRPWSNPSGERQPLDHHELEKKQTREESAPNPASLSAPGGLPVQEYQIPQHYPYPYGYVQGYPYPVDSSSYHHMHMLETDPHYKQQYKQYIEDQHRMYKEQQHQQHQLQHIQQQQQQHQQHHQQASHHGHHPPQHPPHHQSKSHHSTKDERDRSRESKDRNADKMSSGVLMGEHSSKIQHSSNPMGMSGKEQDAREMEMRSLSHPPQSRQDPSAPPSASSSSLKEKQNENHQILKENIELKSQMDDSKNKINQYEMAMIYERHREDMRRFYMVQDRMIEQQQQKLEPGIHHHTHHHQTIQPHGHLQAPSYPSSSLKSHKDDLPVSGPIHPKSSNHYGDSTRPSVVSPAKSDHIKSLHSTSSPKGGGRERDLSGGSKDYMSSSRESSSSKKDGGGKNSDRSESSSREEKKSEKKVEIKSEPEGQKPTMETTGPPPPPTNSYAYLHPSYLQAPPPHFAHMPFEPAHAAMYRGGINPMIVSTPHYANSPYMHPQIRYVTPGACELPVHAQPPDPMAGKMHPSGPGKALDLLHQVSQQYTATTHKIHELTEHAVMSPTPTSTPSSNSATSSASGGKNSSEPIVAVSKMDGSRDASRSPPTQRHLHTHHHTHVGVGYPLYDPYGVAAQKTYT